MGLTFIPHLRKNTFETVIYVLNEMFKILIQRI